MNRRITHIVLHCTATPQTTTVASIRRYWQDSLKWRSPGYHRIILADGSVTVLAPDSQLANGVAGHNANSIHVSYIGGVNGKGQPVANRTAAQRATTERLVKELKLRYPAAAAVGHRDFPGVKKACPSFDVATWLKEVGL